MINTIELLNKVEMFLQEQDNSGYITDCITISNLKMIIEELEKKDNYYEQRMQQSTLSD